MKALLSIFVLCSVLLSAYSMAAGIAFDDFDGGGYGFTSSWSGTQFGLVTSIDPDFGNSLQALGSSTTEYTSSSNIPVLDVSGDATYYLCCLYYATGEDQYAVLKLRNGTPPAGIPSILFRNSGWADAYTGSGSTANEIDFLVNKLYLAVLKIDCNPTGTDDAVYLNLYNLTDGDVVPAVEPTVWQTDGKPGNTTTNFVESSANNIQVVGRGSIDSTFDNVLLTTDWADVYAASQPQGPPPEVDYYVATVADGGDDSNPGTLAEPFATIQKAASLVQPGYTVYIRGGRYPVTSTVVLGSAHSGTQDAPVIYTAYQDEEVILDGSMFIPTDGFALVQDQPTLDRLNPAGQGNVYIASITDSTLQNVLNNPDAQLTQDDQMMQQSRFPNVGFDYVETADVSGEVLNTDGSELTPVGAEITIRGNFQGDWQAELNRDKKARLIGYVSAAWHKEALRLHSVDGADNIQLMDGSSYGLDRLAGMGDPRRPYFDNLLCEIDDPGEWYYDDLENKLYLWPYDDQIDGQTVLGVWAGPKMFDISADYIRLENLTMQCLGDGGSFVDIYGSHDVVAGCTLRYSAPGAVVYNIWNDARNSGLLSCDLYDNNGGGRLYAGSVSNNLIEAGNCFIENCHFTQIHSKSFYGGVGAIKGAGNIFRNNLAHNHNGQICTISGPDHLIELNEVFNIGIEEGDGGSFYQGASFSSVNNTFRHNFWHHIMCIPSLYERAAIYSDDGDSFDNVEENVFYKAGTCFKMNAGAGHTADGNVMLDSRIGLHALGTSTSSATTMYNTDMSHLDSHTSVKDAHLYRAMSDFGIDGWESTANSSNWNSQISSYWRTRYPVLDSVFAQWWNDKAMYKYSTFTDNIQYSNYYGFSVASQATLTGTVNLSDLNDFVDPSVMNFKFAEPRPLWAPDIPFETVGLYADQYRTRVPDKDAYRQIVKDHWNSVPSESNGLSYNPDTINDRIYFNTGKVLLELMQASVPVDIDGSGRVDLGDFTKFAACWVDPTCIETDFDNSGNTGFEDLQHLADHWLNTFTIIAFDNFDGGQVGFTSSWSGTQFGLVTGIASGLGNSFQATGDLITEYTSSSNIPVLDVSGDATYYLSGLYYATGEDQYSVLKLRNGTTPAGVPSILFRNSGWADAYIGEGLTANEIDFLPNKLYFAVLKIDCNPTGTNDAVYLNLYNLTDGEVVPAAEPTVWQTDGKPGNTAANFVETSADNIQVVGRGSIDSTFDNILVTTKWADVTGSVPDAYQ